MNSMKDVTSRITWTRPTQHEYLLDHEGEHVARITLGENDGHAETADGKWSFHRHGFLNPHVLVRDVKTGKQLGRFEATMSGGGLLDLADGRHFRLSANTWKAEWRWLATAGDELVIIDFSGYAVDGSPEGYVEIQEKGRESAHLPMLVTFGCYLIHLIAESEFK
jgi:hypothetical protein